MIPEDVPVFKTCIMAVPLAALSRLREIPLAGFLRSGAGMVTALMEPIMTFNTIIRIAKYPLRADQSAPTGGPNDFIHLHYRPSSCSHASTFFIHPLRPCTTLFTRDVYNACSLTVPRSQYITNRVSQSRGYDDVISFPHLLTCGVSISVGVSKCVAWCLSTSPQDTF
jgi:hypothetical protein